MMERRKVTILILIDGFLQYMVLWAKRLTDNGHNPYFNRWFSAMLQMQILFLCIEYVTILILIDGFLQYKL